MAEKTIGSKSCDDKVVELCLAEDELEEVIGDDEEGDSESLGVDLGAATVCALMTRPEFYWRNQEQLRPDYLGDPLHSALVAIIHKSYGQFGTVPDPFLIKAALGETLDLDQEAEGADKRAFLDEEMNRILELKPLLEDDRQLAILQDEVNRSCKRQAYDRAVFAAQDCIGEGKYEEAMKLFSDAQNVGPTEDNTLDFFSNPDDLMDLLKKDREEVCAVTGFPSLDKARQGGVRKGELIVLVGKPGMGKSAILGHIAVANVREGKKVLFVTLENAKSTVVQRVIASLLDVRMDGILDDRARLSWRLSKFKKTLEGGLRIEEAPGGSVGVEGLRGIVERVIRNGNFVPDVIIVDYLGEMKSDKNSSRYEWMETRAQEIRSLGAEYGCAVITAAQTNRQAESTTTVTANELGDCYGIHRKADMLITLNSDEQERLRFLMRLYVDKNRQGKTGFLVWIQAEFPQMQFNEIEESAYKELEMKPLCGFEIDDDDTASESSSKTSNSEQKIDGTHRVASPSKPIEKATTRKGKKKSPFANRYTQTELDRMRELSDSGGTWEEAAKEITTHSSISVKLKWERLGLGTATEKAAA